MKLRASFDDGGKLDMRVAELMDKYNIQTTFYIPFRWKAANGMQGRESISFAEFKDLASRFEIGSHTISHQHLTRLDNDQARAEVIDSRKAMQDISGQEVKSFCPPRGYYNEYIKDLAKEAGYESMRTTKVGYLTVDDPLEMHTTVHIGYDRKEYDTDWLTYAKAKLQEANPDSIYHFWGHSEEIDRLGQWDRFEEFLELL